MQKWVLQHYGPFECIPGRQWKEILLVQRILNSAPGCAFGQKEEMATGKSLYQASLVAQMVKNLPAMQETQVWSLGWEDALEKGMNTHSSILAWRIPLTEKPGGLQSIVSQRVRHVEQPTLNTRVWVSEEDWEGGWWLGGKREACNITEIRRVLQRRQY